MQPRARSIDVGEQVFAALRMTEHGRDLEDLAAGRIEVGDQRNFIELEPLRAQNVLRHRTVVLADQHEVRAKRDGRFRLPVEARKALRLLGDRRERRVGCIG